MLLMTLCHAVMNFPLTQNILQTKDIAISFLQDYCLSVIEGKEIESVDSYKYLLLIANCASRNMQEQSVQAWQQHLFFVFFFSLQEIISFNVGEKRWPRFIRILFNMFWHFVSSAELTCWVCINQTEGKYSQERLSVGEGRGNGVTWCYHVL